MCEYMKYYSNTWIDLSQQLWIGVHVVTENPYNTLVCSTQENIEWRFYSRSLNTL